MKKMVVTIMMTLFLGVFAVNAVIPAMTVYAAEQNSDGQEGSSTDNQQNDGGHESHHHQ